MREYYITKNDSGQRLNKFLEKAVPRLSGGMMHKYLRLKRIKLNGKRTEAACRLAEGDRVQLYINDEYFEQVREEEAFRRMGYRAEFTTIDWEKKTELVDSGEIDCIWDCFSMEGRENDYQWAGPYLVSRQVVAVDAQSGIETMSDLAGKTIAVQATGKPEAIFLRGGADVPAFRNIISLADRGVQYAMLDCGYTDAIAAHEEAIRQYMKDYGANFRILDDPLLVTGIGVAFSKNDTRGLAAQLDEVFEQMREDGSMEKLVGKYLDDPAHSLEVDALEQ